MDFQLKIGWLRDELRKTMRMIKMLAIRELKNKISKKWMEKWKQKGKECRRIVMVDVKRKNNKRFKRSISGQEKATWKTGNKAINIIKKYLQEWSKYRSQKTR